MMPLRIVRRRDDDEANIMDRSPVGPPAKPLELVDTAPKADTALPTAPAAPTVPTAPAASFAPPATPAPSAKQTAYDSLVAKGSGVRNIHNPVLRTLATIGDALGATFAPAAEQVIPGTEGHHNLEVSRAGHAVEQERAGTKQAAENELHQAEAANYRSKPEVAAAQNETRLQGIESRGEIARLTQEGLNTRAQSANDQRAAAAKAASDARLRAAGFDPETGHPLAEEELSEPLRAQRSLTELRGAQADAQEAQAELARARAANAPDAAALAQAKFEQAERRLNMLNTRLGLAQDTYKARYLGTGPSGEALPGALLTDQNQPVGTANAANVRPTGQQRNKADMGTSAREQLSDIKTIVQSHPEIFGPGHGRATEIERWIGSQDPDAQAFASARTIAADHLAGTFGGRSESALKALDDAIGQFKTNPTAMLAGIDQIDKANSIFIQRGTPRTAGSNAAAAQPVVPPPAPSATIRARDPQGKLHKAPAGTPLPAGWKLEGK